MRSKGSNLVKALAAAVLLAAAGVDHRGAEIEAAYHRFLRACAEILNQPDALERLYANSHDLPGGLIGVAEADRFFRAHRGGTVVSSPRPWRSALEVICWL